jgi:hypothetical protein
VDQEPSWQRQLLVGLSVLLAIGLLIGAILAFIAVQAADYVGIGDGAGTSTSSPEPILPTTGDATHTVSPPPTSTPTPTPTTTHTTRKPQPAFTLAVSPKTVGSFDRINLTGTYPGHDGARLQVQRSLGSGPWADFPVSPTTVSNGTYATYIQTSMLGQNHIRMVDTTTGKMSNVVTVTIG